MSKKVDLSIIVTAHHEGLVAHKTMLSIERACALLDKANYSYEIIVSIDCGDKATKNYFNSYSNMKIKVFEWEHADLSQSRNSAIKHAKGKFVAFIDADDLMSENWLHDGLSFLLNKPFGKYIAHAEYTIEFEGADSIVKKYGATNRDQDILLSVFAARWNSVIIAPTSFIKENPYLPNSAGYGYEDWHMSLNFLEQGLENVLIPKTAIFVRRKLTGSEWARQKSSRSLLHAHPVLKPLFFKKIDLSMVNTPKSETTRQTKDDIKELLVRARIPLGIIKKPLAIARRVKSKYQRPQDIKQTIPSWLEKEWQDLHGIEKLIFPPSPMPQTYHTITDDHYRVGLAYWELCQSINHESYDYVIFVPWLVRGGADLYAINYANTIKKLGKRVLVVATNAVEMNYSEWRNKLDKDIDFIQFGSITRFLATDQKYRLLEQIIENTNIKVMHIINSELAYDFVSDHSTYIQSTDKYILATSYSQSTDKSGRIFGFSHTHLPKIYHLLALITTDNDAVKKMWIEEYAFDMQKIVVHHQPLDIDKYDTTKLDTKNPKQRVLWASRLSPEKLPNLVSEIAEALPNNIHIDMFGASSSDFPVSSLKKHARIHYKGSFDGVETLPTEDYSLFLYTSLFDGMPNTPIEIALRGLPMVVAKVGGLTDFVGKDAYVVSDTTSSDEYAKMVRLALDNYPESVKMATSLNQKARGLFNRKTFEKEVRQLLKNVGLD